MHPRDADLQRDSAGATQRREQQRCLSPLLLSNAALVSTQKFVSAEMSFMH